MVRTLAVAGTLTLALSALASAQGGPDPGPQNTMHEWWFSTVLSDPSDACGSWQAMTTYLSDLEVAEDRLLFTAVVGDETFDFSEAFLPGSLARAFDGARTDVAIGSSAMWTDGERFEVSARTDHAELDLTLRRTTDSLWHRSGVEGWGMLDITFATRAEVLEAELRLPGRTCTASNAHGYFEHVWGTWSRVPMWGVDHLEAHADDGWSVYARRTPMRGEGNLFPFIRQDPDDTWRPALVFTDGTRQWEAAEVSFTRTDGTAIHPDLGIPLPERFVVIGTGLSNPAYGGAPAEVRLTVEDPVLATILFPTTSSGVLEGRADASIEVDGVRREAVAEVEVQRYGTRYPR